MHRVEDYKIAKKQFYLKENIFSFFYRIGFNIISIYNNDDRKAFVWIKMNSIYINLKNWEDIIENLHFLILIPLVMNKMGLGLK